MSPRTEQQFKDIREEKKNLIMSVALELFGSKGYYSTSISDIARKAGISKGLLYNYFKSKEELIREIINAGLDMFDRLVDPNRDGVLTSDELRYFIDEMFKLLLSQKHFWKLYFSLFLQKPVLELVEKKFDELIKSYISILSQYFRSRGFKDPDTEALLFGAMLDGIGMNFIANTTNFPVERVKKRLIEIYCKD